MSSVLDHFTNTRRSGNGHTARCPAHEDKQNSLKIDYRDGIWLIHCFAGCEVSDVLRCAGLKPSDLYDHPGHGRGVRNPTDNRATVQPGLTLAAYAEAKNLPVEFLQECGLSDVSYQSRNAVRMLYRKTNGEEIAVRFRIAMQGDRFRWRQHAKPALYGLDRIEQARSSGTITIVEGESDCHTLWHHGVHAVGVPGAGNWRENRDAPQFEGFATIFVVIEPDRGGDAVRSWLSKSTIRDRAKLVRLPVKDVSALHLENPEGFDALWQLACTNAVAWKDENDSALSERRSAAWEACSTLAKGPNILASFYSDLMQSGVVGEESAAKLVFLAVVSRLLDKPVSLAIKGPSSGGKSFLVESVLRFFPPEAFYALTAMSDRALAYSTEPLKHRHLVLYEAAGMTSEWASYLIRSLLSEGRVRYETVEKTDEGMSSCLIEREGPTGLIVTTTSVSLHRENETRLLSLTVTDTPGQTRAVMLAVAKDSEQPKPDLDRWHNLQIWLATGSAGVIIPYGERLAGSIEPVAVRLRRDFMVLLHLIKAHALLHQESRSKDADGRVIATLTDYAAVRELVRDLMSAGVEASVPPEVRQTVSAVRYLIDRGNADVHVNQVAEYLQLDKSAASRRVAAAERAGYLINQEQRRGRPKCLVLGTPLPMDRELLPSADRLVEPPEGLHGCTVVGGDTPPPSPHSEEDDNSQEPSWHWATEDRWPDNSWSERL